MTGPRTASVLRWPAAVALLLVGAVTGLCSTMVHQIVWALPLAVAAPAVAMAALRPGVLTRLVFAIGWVGMVGLCARTRNEGYLIAADLPGLVLLATCVALVIGALVTLPPPRSGASGAG